MATYLMNVNILNTASILKCVSLLSISLEKEKKSRAGDQTSQSAQHSLSLCLLFQVHYQYHPNTRTPIIYLKVSLIGQYMI